MPTTNNDFPFAGAPGGGAPLGNFNDAQIHRHVGYAALAANALKSQGTRVLAVGVANGSDPTIWLPNVSGPTAFAGDVASADYTTATASGLGDALRAIVLEACRASVTVNKLLYNHETEVYDLADGWEFSATVPADRTQSPFSWLAPTVSTGTSVNGLTGQSPNSTGSLLFQWEPEDALPTQVTVDEVVQAEHFFVDATCQDNSTSPPTLLIDGQTTLPVVFDVSAEQFVTCDFRNIGPDTTAVTLGSLGVAAPPPGLLPAGALLLLGLLTAVALRRRAG